MLSGFIIGLNTGSVILAGVLFLTGGLPVFWPTIEMYLRRNERKAAADFVKRAIEAYRD
jgi:hypothetical protein